MSASALYGTTLPAMAGASVLASLDAKQRVLEVNMRVGASDEVVAELSKSICTAIANLVRQCFHVCHDISAVSTAFPFVVAVFTALDILVCLPAVVTAYLLLELSLTILY